MSPRRAAALALVAAVAWAGAGSAAAQPVRQQLPGGLTVLVRENTATAVAAASLFVRMGSRWETEDDAGISHLLQQVLLKGTEKRSALEVAETAESLGGGIGASADLDYSEIRATALARNWRTMLELIADVALRPSLPVSRDRRRAPRHPDRAPQPPGPAVLAGHGHAHEPRLRGSPVRPSRSWAGPPRWSASIAPVCSRITSASTRPRA